MFRRIERRTETGQIEEVRGRTFSQGNIEFRPFCIQVSKFYWGDTGAHLELEVMDRDRGNPIPLRFEERWDEWNRPRSDEEMLSRLEDFLTRFIAHEVQELLLHNGVRRDPHAEDGFSKP